MKQIITILSLLLPFVINGQKIHYTELQSERLMLKNIAFCECLNHSSGSIDSLIINDGSIAGYFEKSNYNIEVYDTIDSLSKRYSQTVYSSKDQKPLVLMKCLDFYNSRELEDVIKSFDKYIIRKKEQ